MFLKIESYRKGIILSTIFNIANKGLVFAGSMIVAYYFGTQLKTDIYFYAYNTIVIFAAFITSLNASVLLPESMRLRIQKGEAAATQFLNFFFYLYIFITLAICVIVFFNPVKAFTAISGFSKQSLQEQSTILLLATPLILLMPVVNLLTDILTSYKFFSLPMIVGILNGLFSIFFVLIFHKLLDVLSLLTGLILAYGINLIILVSLMSRKLHWKFSFAWLRMEKRIWKNIAWAQAGNITTSFSSYAPLYVLSGFSGGIITSLTFAQQISSIPTNLITNQFSSVAGIKFNELYAKQEFTTINRIFISTTSFLLFILIPVSGLFYLYSSEITSFLLERGAFERSGVIYTSTFLKYLGLLLPMLAVNTLIARLFMAGQKIIQSVIYQVAFNCVLIVFIIVGVRYKGIIGYPLSLVFLHVANVLFCYFLLKIFFPQIIYSTVLLGFLKLLLVNAAIFVAILFIKQYLLNLYSLLSLMIGSALYLLVLLIVNRYAKFNTEVNAILDKVTGFAFSHKANGKKAD